MVKIFLELSNFLLAVAPLLISTAFFTLFAILLSKSIKKYATAYYIAFAIPFALVAIPTILRWCGIDSLSVTGVPVLGQLLRDYIHMGTLGHPLLIVIMYMGALDTRKSWVKNLMSIRKELSIISGFPVLTHTLIRVASNFPASLKYFTDHETYIASGNVVSELGAGVSSTSLVLGIILVVLFIPLWITSFDSVHRRMGGARWKKFQRWAYVFYAVMFIHAIGIQVGGVLNPKGGSQPKTTIETTVAQTPVKPAGIRDNSSVSKAAHKDRQAQVAPQTKGRRQAKGFADFEVDSSVKRWVNITSLLLIYGSYLYLRLRKARNSKHRRSEQVSRS